MEPQCTFCGHGEASCRCRDIESALSDFNRIRNRKAELDDELWRLDQEENMVKARLIFAAKAFPEDARLMSMRVVGSASDTKAAPDE